MSKGSKQTQTTSPWGGQAPYLMDLFGMAQQYAKTPQEFFPGQTFAGFDPLQLQGQNLAANYALGGFGFAPTPGVNLGNETQPRFSHRSAQTGLPGLIGQSQQALGFGLNPLANPFIQQAGAGLPPAQLATQSAALGSLDPQITAQTPQLQGLGQIAPYLQPLAQNLIQAPMQQFTQDILGSIRGDLGVAGQTPGNPQYLKAAESALRPISLGVGQALGQLAGRGLGAAEHLASLDLGAQQLGEQQRATQVGQGLQGAGLSQNLLQGLYSPTLGAFQSSLGQAPSIGAFGLMPSQTLMDVGGQRQAMEQQGISEAMARHYFPQQELLQRLQGYQGLIGRNYGGTTTMSQAQNPLAQLLGLGMMGAGAYFGGPWGAQAGQQAAGALGPIASGQPWTMPLAWT